MRLARLLRKAAKSALIIPLRIKGVRAFLVKTLKVSSYDDLEFDYQDYILKYTCITKLLASTQEGLFSFLPEDKVVGRALARDRVWEEEETRYLKSIVKPGDLAIDVGANLGWYTVVLSRLVTPRGRVLAFEPEPRNHQLLQENLSLSRIGDWTRCYQLALLDSERQLQLLLSGYNLGDHHVQLSDAIQHRHAARRSVTINTRRLDAVLEEEGLSKTPIRVLKIDTQGAEVGVLRGANEALKRTEYLFSEFSPSDMHNVGFTSDEFAAQVEPAFESFARFKEMKGDPLDFLPIGDLWSDMQKPLNEFGFTNYVFRKTRSGPIIT